MKYSHTVLILKFVKICYQINQIIQIIEAENFDCMKMLTLCIVIK